MTLLYVCFCLNIPYLAYVVYIAGSQQLLLLHMPEGSLSNTNIFPLRYIIALLYLESIDSFSTLYLVAILNSKSPQQKKHNNRKNVTLNGL